MSSNGLDDSERMSFLQPALDPPNQEETSQPTSQPPTSPQSPLARIPQPSGSAASDPTVTSTPTPTPTVALPGTDGRLQSISPGRDAGGRVRSPTDAEITVRSRPELARPVPISSTIWRRPGHDGTRSEPGSAGGFSAFPVVESTPMLRGGGHDVGAISDTGGDEVGVITDTGGDEVGVISDTESDGAGVLSPTGGGEVRRMMGKSLGVESGVMEDRGHPMSEHDNGVVGDISANSGVYNTGDRGEGEGDTVENGDSDGNGGSGCDGGDDCERSVTDSQRNELNIDYDSVSDENISVSGETGIDRRIDGEDQDSARLPELAKPISTTVDADPATSVTAVEGLITDRIDFPPDGTQPSDSSPSESTPSDLPAFLVPQLDDPAYKTPLGYPPTPITSLVLPGEQDATDAIIFPETAISPSKNHDDHNATDRGKLGAILFKNPPSRPDDNPQPGTGAGLPLYVIIAAASGGCFILLSTLTLVVLRWRRGQRKAPDIAPGSVFEPEPGDRGPIANLIRQNRLDQQAIVPAPVSLWSETIGRAGSDWWTVVVRDIVRVSWYACLGSICMRNT